MPTTKLDKKSRTSLQLLKRLQAIFMPHDRVLVTIVADPDSMASAKAFKRILWRRVKSVTIANTSEISRPDNAKMVQLLDIPLINLNNLSSENYTKIVILDGQPHHHEILQQFDYDVVIDHHPDKTSTPIPFVDIRPDYGATATIMTEYLRAAEIIPNKKLATSLLYGIRVDTDNFGINSIEKDLHAFQFLFHKADRHILRELFTSDIGSRDLVHFKNAFDNMRITGSRVSCHIGSIESPDILVLVADFLMRCHDITWALVSGIINETLIVVIRNENKRRNAGKLAQRAFGRYGRAGGHRSKARAEVSLATLGHKIIRIDRRFIDNFLHQRVNMVIGR